MVEKAVMGEIRKKGLEFLTDIELGNAPPVETVKRNVRLDQERLEEYRTHSEVPQIISRTRRYVRDAESRISSMKFSLRYEEIANAPYRGELKPWLARQNPESLFVARLLVEDMINGALRVVLEDENRLEQLRAMRGDLQRKEEELEEVQRTNADRSLFLQVANEMFKRVMLRLMKEAASETATVNLIAKSVALNIIVNSIKQERVTQNPVGRLQKLYTDLRDPLTLKKKETGLMFNFKTQKEIDWKKVKRGKRNLNQEQVQRRLLEQKPRASIPGEEAQQHPEEVHEPHDDEDLDVIVLDPRKECVDSLGIDVVRDYEIGYWEKLAMHYMPFRDHANSVKTSVTYLGLSPFKETVLVGMSNGEIYVYDATSSPAIATALIASSTQQPIIDIQFGMDNIGHLAIRDESGHLRFCYNAYNLKTNVSKDAL